MVNLTKNSSDINKSKIGLINEYSKESENKLIAIQNTIFMNNTNSTSENSNWHFLHKGESSSKAEFRESELELKLEVKFEKILLYTLKNEHVEEGYKSSADELIDDYITKYFNAKTWLSNIISRNVKDIDFLGKLLLLISRIPPEKLSETGYMIAMAMLNHKEIIIRENSIRIFETYFDLRSLEMLQQSKKDSVKWIEDYKQLVINDIKKSLEV